MSILIGQGMVGSISNIEYVRLIIRQIPKKQQYIKSVHISENIPTALVNPINILRYRKLPVKLLHPRADPVLSDA